ncbi:hypothetical protein GCK72_019840 [Caenorhabditis remanei]|uniref:Uncharacterized protein n=1 Tax=Caenorhabditis remanei TaxID=31234 RepID=A0A6A5GEW7_CAERE|nr:hypothetical protein GCK72_019840 [Caenorhabditis remanei]KAF1753284.1 hypothetical protein GCK72_019840 [Caenorhabditis remanei]
MAFLAFAPAIMNTVGGLLGGLVGQPPPTPPPLPAPPPPAPPQIVYVTNPAKEVVEKVFITQAPYPPATRAPETLTTYGIIGIIFILVVCMISMAGGIGFYMWQSSKMEAEKRANESRDRDRDFYEMEAARGRGGRRGGRRSRSTMSTGGTSGTKTRKHRR